jgi:hypothetical protein
MGSFALMPDWVPDMGGQGAASYYGVELPSVPIPHNEDWGSVSPLMEAWAKRTPAQREHLRVPLRRINYALRRWSDVDRAIDLGVALEAAFLNDREPERGELSFTIRLRAARFMGLDRESRQRIAKKTGFLYRLRSIAVHSGTIKNERDGQNTHEALKEGVTFAATVLAKQIMSGPPDWADVVFG